MPEKHRCRVLETEWVTHDVKRFVVEKPAGFLFEHGQSALVSVDRDEWRDQERPFSFTSLNRDPCLEFTIKIYPAHHHGTTSEFRDVQPGDILLVGEPFGSLTWRGPGIFIAGGAGITPFISMLRHLHAERGLEGTRLFYSNMEPDDIILKGELKRILGDNCVFTLTRKEDGQHSFSHVDSAFLKQHVRYHDRYYYVCGPPQMVEDVTATLMQKGIPDVQIITEESAISPKHEQSGGMRAEMIANAETAAVSEIHLLNPVPL